jgi:pSer/pThr/pTyr-binding forkhead associated (FHA) protein
MPPIVLLSVRLALLALLWLFVLAAIRAIRLDIFGPRVPKAARPSKRAARAVAAPPPKPARGKVGKAPRELVVIEGALVGTRLALDGSDPITIGRAPDSTLVLTDDYVSTHHARIFVREGRWLVEDLGSTNGTYLDRSKVSGPTPIGAGAKVRVGKTVLELRR